MFFQIFTLLLCALPPSTCGFTTSRSTSASTSRSTTYQRTDPESGVTHTCDRCAPGTYLHTPCTDTRKSVCDACPPGSFTELWNYIEACIPCGACSENQEVRTQCSASLDTTCRCIDGHYYVPEYNMCIQHSPCPTGQGVVSKGTPTADTRCQLCPKGSFSERVSALDGCTAHTNCSAGGRGLLLPGGRGLLLPGGRGLLLPGGAWHDSVCTSCEELREHNAFDYFRGILPGFLVHRNFPVTQLRRILASLPRPGLRPRWEALGRKELHHLLTSWVLQARAEDLSQLLHQLRRGGVARRLRYKLTHIQRAIQTQKALCEEKKEEERGGGGGGVESRE